ncbi:MAG TPA: thiol reductant ABC exporter subunit CydD [Actinomycetes bacterium]
MKPLDPRLLRYARATRTYLLLTVALGVVTAGLVIAQAALVAGLVDDGFSRREPLTLLRGPMVLLLVVVVGRAAVAWLTEVAAQRASARAKSELREQLLARVVELGPVAAAERGTADLTTLATQGVDALDGYFSRYLPQLVLAVLVPVSVLGVVLGQDWVSALIIAVTLPLIPVFMIVIGLATRQRTERQFRTLQVLAGRFLEAVAGLPTLKVFGRAKAQAAVIRDVTDTYRRRTMHTLRLAFASSLVLELIASLSVAVVAVSIGLRLLSGELSFHAGLFVLLLAPEAYLPLRAVGANFHASAEGLAAAEQVFTVLETELPAVGSTLDFPDPSVAGLEVSGLTVSYAGRGRPALDAVTLSVRPGEILALTGPSGCGKSTLLSVLLGFVRPDSGEVSVGGVDLAEIDPTAWRAGIAWVPQRPHLFATTLDANVRLGRPDAPGAAVDAAVEAAGLGALVRRLPQGLATPLGEGGAGLSAGERQRVALARAFLRDAPLLLLDEPTAGLDGATEAGVLDAVRRLARGRTVLLVAHRPALVAIADRTVELPAAAALEVLAT